MRFLFFAIILSTLIPTTATAQWTDFPPDICCDELKPKPKLIGPVRSVLEVERNMFQTFENIVTTYDATGRLIERLKHSAGSPPEAPPGKLIRLDYKIIYSYDSQGRLAQKNFYHEGGSHYAKDLYKYDGQGRLVEEISQRKGRLSSSRVYTYDPARQTITAMATDYSYEKRPPQIRKSVFIFNAAEHWVKMSVYAGDKVDWAILYSFDEKGNLIKMVRDGSFKSTYEYSYKFDNRGNWIEREERDQGQDKESLRANSVPRMVTFRVISYHDEK